MDGGEPFVSNQIEEEPVFEEVGEDEEDGSPTGEFEDGDADDSIDEEADGDESRDAIEPGEGDPAFEAEVPEIEDFIDIVVVGAHAACAEEFDDDDVEAIEEHGEDAAGQGFLEDEEWQGDSEGDDDDLAGGHVRDAFRGLSRSDDAGCCDASVLVNDTG